jgi:hypothetical protein
MTGIIKRQAARPSPFSQARGSAAMLEKSCYQYRKCVPARTCEPGCRKKEKHRELPCKDMSLLLVFGSDLSGLSYLHWHLSHVGIDFFGQLVARPRSMQGYILYLSPDKQVSHHSTLTL